MTQTRFRLLARTSLFLALATAGAVPALRTLRADDLTLTSDDTSALFDRVKGSVVQVRSGDKGFINAGSGFFIDDKGTLATSSTVLGENTSARVMLNGMEVAAKVLGNDPRSGLTLLKIEYDGSPALPLGHSSDLKSGNSVVAIGFPMNLPAAPSNGVVSGFDASYLAHLPSHPSVQAEERFATTHIHANVSISPGEVGGPLLNPRGEVVGMVATSPDDGDSIYALPVEAMQKIIGDFAQFGRAKHGWVGIKFMEAPDTQHDGRTVRVVEVVPHTPAATSGIIPGDVVMRVDSREVYRPADVLDASFFSHVGGTMAVVVRRDETLYNFSFAVIVRPAAPPVAPARGTTALVQPDRGFAAR